MKVKNGTTTVVKGSEVTFTRVFNAPRELVWEAWTNPEYVSKWWGPNGFSLTTYEMEVAPGGI